MTFVFNSCVFGLSLPAAEGPQQQHGEPVPDLGQRHQGPAGRVPCGQSEENDSQCKRLLPIPQLSNPPPLPPPRLHTIPLHHISVITVQSVGERNLVFVPKFVFWNF